MCVGSDWSHPSLISRYPKSYTGSIVSDMIGMNSSVDPSYPSDDSLGLPGFVSLSYIHDGTYYLLEIAHHASFILIRQVGQTISVLKCITLHVRVIVCFWVVPKMYYV